MWKLNINVINISFCLQYYDIILISRILTELLELINILKNFTGII